MIKKEKIFFFENVHSCRLSLFISVGFKSKLYVFQFSELYVMVLVLSCDSCSLLAIYGVPQIQGRLWFFCYPVIVAASWLVLEYLRYKVGYGSCVIL